MKNEAIIDGITVGGQPTPEELTSGRFAAVISVRRSDEPDADVSPNTLAGTTTPFTSVPFTVETVTKDDIARVREAVEAAKGGPVLIH
ncbi:MAG: hypothetical protein NVS4B5_05240 [Vulcanimicrobiaceae bacterium]